MTALPLFDAARLDPAEEFACTRLHCPRITRLACGKRYRAAQEPMAPCGIRACHDCATGELHGALVVGPTRMRRRVGDAFRSKAVTPREILPYPPEGAR